MTEESKGSRNVIEVTNLKKAYGRVKALDNVTFTVSKGEVVGFLGPNGAGKSTTMRILCGLTSADSGKARVSGVNLAEEEGAVRKHIGYLPENNPLPEDLRVSEYLRFRGRLKGLSGGLLRERLDATLNLCDLRRTAAERLIGNLSKGFRQRVGIAEALLAEPKVLVLDEPTIGLDPRQTGIMRNLLERLRGETTFLISSHILSEVEASCDRMMIMNRGKIVAKGTLSELQAEYLEKTILEIVASCDREIIERVVQNINPNCELTEESPLDTTGKRRFSFSISQDSTETETVLRSLVSNDAVKIYEFAFARPDLETIFLKATKRSWEETGSSGQAVREVSATLQPEEEGEHVE